MATVGVHLPLLTGQTLTLKLYPRNSGSIANGASGDSLAESGTGYFTATVAESLTGIHRADVLQSSTLKYQGWVNMDYGSPIVDDPSQLASAQSTGARTVTITVNDGTTALQNATVRMTNGAESITQATNVSGVATFNLDDATWTVSITKAGYSFAGTTLVVDGTETQTYSMTALSITPPATPGLSAVEVLCIDAEGQPESGVKVDIRIAVVPSGSQNVAYKGTKQHATSDVNGIARFEVVQGATYEWKRGTADVWTRVAIDNDAVTSVTSIIGSP